MHLFSARTVTKQFANHTALDQVSIDVGEGRIFGLLGPNGAGKTTLIRIINQILAPDSGELNFMGRKLKPDDVSLIGYLPEERGLYKKMTVGEQSVYLAQLKGLSRAEAMKRLKYWFGKFEITGWWNKKVEELSKGMQQKVQFLITIVHEPKLLIFDEPFSGFDPINANMLKEEILAQRAAGATIIFSTHNMASVEELCDDIALINKSKVILAGSMKEIRTTYRSNTYEITYDGYNQPISGLLPDGFALVNESSDQVMRFSKIRIPENASPNDLLAILLPSLTIHGFSEVIPGMNDIFIQAVTQMTQPS